MAMTKPKAKRMALGLLVLTLAGTAPLLKAADLKQPVEMTTVERVNFAPGGTILINDSFAFLDVIGWEQPEVELTVTKRTERYYDPQEREQALRRLADVRITTERRSDNELSIATLLPPRAHSWWISPPLPTTTKGGVTLEYRILLPRNSHLVIHHGSGSVFVSEVSGDIEVTSGGGDIVLRLPKDPGKYSIDAKCTLCTLWSDVPGTRRNYGLGQTFVRKEKSPAQRIHARIGGVGSSGIEIRSGLQGQYTAAVH